MKNLIIIKCLVTVLVMFMSCNSNILDYDDPNNYDTRTYFKTPEEIQKAANATYSGFYYGKLMGWYWEEIFDVMANEANPTQAAEAGTIPFWKYEFNSNSDIILNYWRMLYRVILRANLTILKGEEYLAKHKDENLMVKQSIGEACFLRGWAYTHLAFYWGRVPLRLEYDQTGNEDAPRSATVEEVWAVAEADFKKAQTLLPESWDSKNTGRATFGAATGFLGKLYLYTGKYGEAETEFAKMTKFYSLIPGPRWLDMFGETDQNGVESVFEVQFKYYVGANAGNAIGTEPEGAASQVKGRETRHPQLYGWNDWNNWYFPDIRKLDFIYDDEDGNEYVDPRAALTFYERAGGIGDDTWCDHTSEGPKPFEQDKLYYKKYLNKEYKETENNQQSSNNIVLMRYTDVLLMRAECALLGATPDEDKALGFINEVRDRIGAFEYEDTYTADEVFELLKRERQIEFMGEYHRFNDLKRWGMLKETMDAEMAANGANPIDAKYYLFPIPQGEIDNNLKLGRVDNDWN